MRLPGKEVEVEELVTTIMGGWIGSVIASAGE
jgi:hypothetical protein